MRVLTLTFCSSARLDFHPLPRILATVFNASCVCLFSISGTRIPGAELLPTAHQWCSTPSHCLAPFFGRNERIMLNDIIHYSHKIHHAPPGAPPHRQLCLPLQRLLLPLWRMRLWPAQVLRDEVTFAFHGHTPHRCDLCDPSNESALICQPQPSAPAPGASRYVYPGQANGVYRLFAVLPVRSLRGKPAPHVPSAVVLTCRRLTSDTIWMAYTWGLPKRSSDHPAERRPHNGDGRHANTITTFHSDLFPDNSRNHLP
jgi:hypothetical protein